MTKKQALKEFKWQARNRQQAHENNMDFVQSSTERKQLKQAVDIIKDTDWAIERLNRYELEWLELML